MPEGARREKGSFFVDECCCFSWLQSTPLLSFFHDARASVSATAPIPTHTSAFAIDARTRCVLFFFFFLEMLLLGQFKW